MSTLAYLTPLARKVEPVTNREFHFEKISPLIQAGVQTRLPDLTILSTAELAASDEGTLLEKVLEVDVVLCDLTTVNPNVVYVFGFADARRIPLVPIKAARALWSTEVQLRYPILNYDEDDIDDAFLDAVAERITSALESPDAFVAGSEVVEPAPPTVFVSYSHRDEAHLDRLLVHLKPLVEEGRIDAWVDRRIMAGDQWKSEVEQALMSATAAIILVSADFLASDFIVNDELPPLLEQAERENTRIIPIVLSPCRFGREPRLRRFQAINDPERPLTSMKWHEQEEVYDQVARVLETVYPAGR